MKNSEKGKFEAAWQQAFSMAEQAPSEEVWAGVDQDLNKAETLTMKRRVVFYQRLAAASILFALLMGGLSIYYMADLTDQELSLTQMKSNEITSPDVTNDPSTSTMLPDETKGSSVGRMEQSHRDTNNSKSDSEVNASGNAIATIHPSIVIGADDVAKNDNIINHENNRRQPVIRNYPSRLSMIPEPSVAISGNMKEVTIVRKLPAMPSSYMSSKSDKQTRENLWASLGASTGNYSPSSDFSASSPSTSSVAFQNTSGLNDSQSANSTSSSKGSVFSVGMNVGKRISKHWLLQGGVSYINQGMGYTSNYAVVDASNNVRASVAEYASVKSFSTVVPVSSPYQINSINEFISIPMQAGYLLVDRKFGLQLNSGVSTDIFMQNTLTDKSGQLDSYSSGAGESSPFRTVSWAGLMGTELSYKIATQYRISIAPGLRYSLGSVLKTEYAPSNPLAWDVGFRFRYIFK